MNSNRRGDFKIDEPQSSPELFTTASFKALLAACGLLLPYGAIILGWSLGPDTDSARTTVNRIVVGATLLGFVPGALWFWSRPRSVSWCIAVALVVVTQVVGVFVFNFWYYVAAGGAFP